MAVIFDGREFAKFKQAGFAIDLYRLKGEGVVPKMVSILVGDDVSSKVYVTLKEKKAKEIGAHLQVFEVGVRRHPDYIFNCIKHFNARPDFHGIMLQLPLPAEFEEFKEEFINTIYPRKDVDGLRDDSNFSHPTAMAVMQIIDYAKANVQRRFTYRSKTKVVVVGASGFVGKHIVRELKKKHYRVYEADDHTKNLAAITKKGEILISATGVPGLIKQSMVKRGAVVIDVGSPQGDVAFEEVKEVASFITPVPGGVGPVTIMCLMQNLVTSALEHLKLKPF